MGVRALIYTSLFLSIRWRSGETILRYTWRDIGCIMLGVVLGVERFESFSCHLTQRNETVKYNPV